MPRIFTYHVSSLVSVHDGDTCTVIVDLGFDLSRKVDIRVNGIDTPEMTGESRAAAIVARDMAAAWIKSRIDHLILLSKELDKYGRVLGDLQDTVDGSKLSEYMVTKKLAHAYSGGTRLPWSTAEYLAIRALQ